MPNKNPHLRELAAELLRETETLAGNLGMTAGLQSADNGRITIVCCYAGNAVADVSTFKGRSDSRDPNGKRRSPQWWLRVLHRATGLIAVQAITWPKHASLVSWLASQLALALERHLKAKAATDAAVALCTAVPAPMVRYTHTITSLRARPGEVDIVVTLAPEDVAHAVATIDEALKRTLLARHEERHHDSSD